MPMFDGILPTFRDEETVVLDLIEAYYADPDHSRPVDTGDQTPADEDLEGVLRTVHAFIRVGRVGGASVRGAEHTDRPVIDIDVMTYDSRATAKKVAQEIEQLLISSPHPIDYCNVLMAPQRVPWVEGSRIVRMYASYQLSLRR